MIKEKELVRPLLRRLNVYLAGNPAYTQFQRSNTVNTFRRIICLFLAVSLFGGSGNLYAAENDKEKAFKEVLQESMPLSPSQIERLKRVQEERQIAITGKPANVRARTVSMNIQPGMKLVDIIMLPAYSTTISFFDQTGAIWPVKRATAGNPSAFQVLETAGKEESTNIVTTSCVSDSGHSNLTVVLTGLDIPIMFPIKIAASRKKNPPEIDGSLIVRISGFGPNANPPVVEPRPKDPVSDAMISYLDGVAPEGAQLAELDPPNKDITAWRSGGLLFLRTQNPIIWPAWTSAVRGPGQVRVYEVQDVSSILVSSDGRIKRYAIKTKEAKGMAYGK